MVGLVAGRHKGAVESPSAGEREVKSQDVVEQRVVLAPWKTVTYSGATNGQLVWVLVVPLLGRRDVVVPQGLMPVRCVGILDFGHRPTTVGLGDCLSHQVPMVSARLGPTSPAPSQRQKL